MLTAKTDVPGEEIQGIFLQLKSKTHTNDSLVVRNLLPATSSVIFLEYDIHEKQSKNIGSAQHADSDMSESNCYGKHCNGKDEG